MKTKIHQSKSDKKFISGTDMVEKILTIVDYTHMPITSFIKMYHKQFKLSHKELHVLLNELIKKGYISYDKGFLSRESKSSGNNQTTESVPTEMINSDYEENNKLEEKTNNKPESEITITQLIMQSCLSERAKNIILCNGFSSGDLYSLDLGQLLHLQNCGRKTAFEILDFVIELKNNHGVTNCPLINNIGTSAYSDKLTLRALPLFSNRADTDITIDDLHKDYKASVKLSDLSLSVRTSRVLKRLGMQTIGEVMLTPAKKLWLSDNFGQKCFKEITDVVINIVLHEGKEVIKNNITLSNMEVFSAPPKESDLLQLPLFSNKPAFDITINDLHEDYKASIKLSDLSLSVRTSRVLKRLGMHTIGEVMLSSAKTLLAQRNFGRKCLNELKDIIQSLISFDSGVLSQKQCEHDLTTVDYSSYGTMITSFLECCKLNERDQALIISSLFFDGDKKPTLEQLGQHYGLTRERIRQILKKEFEKCFNSINLNKLSYFWEQIIHIVISGGGMISLTALTDNLQNELKWTQQPNPIALAQLLNLWDSSLNLKYRDDVLSFDCECLSCTLPTEQLYKMKLQENYTGIHIDVVSKKIAGACLRQCTKRPVQNFHRAYIKWMIEKTGGSYVLHEELVMSQERWLKCFGTKLENIIIHILEKQGRPLHFKMIANIVRTDYHMYKNVNDHNIHAAMIRYNDIEIIGRGTYGLKSWGMGGYRPVSSAIEDLLREKELPLRIKDIIKTLKDEFSESNIRASLTKNGARFIGIGDGFYVLKDHWFSCTCNDFITSLPPPLKSFANYLLSKNNYSYKLVMALVFIQVMDKSGVMNLKDLKKKFFYYYLSRYKEGLTVEKDSAIISKINQIDPVVTQNRAIRRPIESFLSSGFFFQSGNLLFLRQDQASSLIKQINKELFLFTLFKGIEDYYASLESSPTSLSPLQQVARTAETSQQQYDSINERKTEEQDNQVPTIMIKKKSRGKIRL